jgi:MoxR-like ATPase
MTTRIKNILSIALMVPTWIRGEELLDYQGDWGLPLVLIGPPGIGKTRMVNDVSEQADLLCFTFPIDSLEVEDLSGIIVNTPTGLQRLSDNQGIREMIEVGEGVIFLDEINTGRGVDAAINRLVYEREFCRQRLPPGIRVLAAMNPPEYAAGGHPLPASMANRLCHIHANPPSVSEWSSYLLGVSESSLSLADARNKMRESWEVARSRSTMGVMSFLQARESLLMKKFEDGEDHSVAWASPRTWLMATNTLATCYALNATPGALVDLLAGCIGEGPSGELLSFLERQDLPSLSTVLAGNWVPDPHRLDVMYAVTQSLLGLLSGMAKKTPLLCEANIEQAAQIYRVILSVQAAGAKDVVYPLLRKLTTHFGTSALLVKKEHRAVAELAQKACSTYGSAVWLT